MSRRAGQFGARGDKPSLNSLYVSGETLRKGSNMPRPLRTLAEGCVYHVTCRANDRQSLFATDSDRTSFLHELDRTVIHRRWRVFAYCLMGNHFHIALETPRPNLADGMRDLQSGYARRYNRTHSRTNHVFGDRYAAKVIADDPHLFATIRYIARNPAAQGWSKRLSNGGGAATPRSFTTECNWPHWTSNTRWRSFIPGATRSGAPS